MAGECAQGVDVDLVLHRLLIVGTPRTATSFLSAAPHGTPDGASQRQRSGMETSRTPFTASAPPNRLDPTARRSARAASSSAAEGGLDPAPANWSKAESKRRLARRLKTSGPSCRRRAHVRGGREDDDFPGRHGRFRRRQRHIRRVAGEPAPGALDRCRGGAAWGRPGGDRRDRRRERHRRLPRRTPPKPLQSRRGNVRGNQPRIKGAPC